MTDSSKRMGNVAGEGADVRAFGDRRGQNRAVSRRFDESKIEDGRLARLHSDLLARAGAGGRRPPVDLERRVGRWDLFDLTCEAGQRRFGLGAGRAHVARRESLTLGVDRVRLLAEADRKLILLAGVEHAAAQLGRFTECDWKHAGRQWIERAAVAYLRLRLAGLPENPLHGADGGGRAKPERLVEDDPAVEHLSVREAEAQLARFAFAQTLEEMLATQRDVAVVAANLSLRARGDRMALRIDPQV